MPYSNGMGSERNDHETKEEPAATNQDPPADEPQAETSGRQKQGAIYSRNPEIAALVPALERLDRRLERAAKKVEKACGSKLGDNPYRGLFINKDEFNRLLVLKPGAPILEAFEDPSGAPLKDLAGQDSRLAKLKESCGLSLFDMDIIIIALAPELDLRYERLFAYLQEDVARRRPTVDLALNLLCPSAAERLAWRVHFAHDAPLIRAGLIHLIPDPHQVQPPLLAQFLKLDEQVIHFILGQDELDARLKPFCRLIEPKICLDEIVLNEETRRSLRTYITDAWDSQKPLRLFFQGPPGAGQGSTAEALAIEVNTPLVAVNLSLVPAEQSNWEQTLKLLFREAGFRDAILYLEGVDRLRVDERRIDYQYLHDELVRFPGIVILSGELPWTDPPYRSMEVVNVTFGTPEFDQRKTCWATNLAMAGIAVEASDVDTLAGRFRLTARQIARAVTGARSQACWREAAGASGTASPSTTPEVTSSDLFDGARAQSSRDLASLTHKIDCKFTFKDIILPRDTIMQLKEVCQRVARQQRVLGDWGFDQKLSVGKGVNALFAGPSGTGKTMAAEIVAGKLGLDLYKIDLSRIMSKYIGEVEKNLDRVFQAAAAENANAIILFDEADALFGHRSSEIRHSTDRYANIEISYLLQKMEDYRGISILTSNLRQNLDEAFVRRLAFTIHFPFPDEDGRRRIWEKIWPKKTPLAATVDLDSLAYRFKLSGGNIKNIALAAAFLAADNGGEVTMEHLLHATNREYQKLGKPLSSAEMKSSVGEDSA
ncbi:AAA family ATPase [Candidatus Zixiibacteriota bacterium]